MKWLLLLFGCLACKETNGISLRKIYTLFTDEKTWNEASAICESQFGQLAKMEDEGDFHEINHLDNTKWSNRVRDANFTWIGLHQPFTASNATWVYQDCEVKSPDLSVDANAGGLCAAMDPLNKIWAKTCSMQAIFICQRYEGDCWYEPKVQQRYNVSPALVETLSPATLPASDCAMQCRNRTHSGKECWGFLYDLQHTLECQLYFLDETNASVIYPDATPVFNDSFIDTVFYVRKCFEDALDTKNYNLFDDPNSEPETICSTAAYPGDKPAMNVCFCSTEEHPTIPEPITAEEKAARLVEELSIESSNTSSATRKLISAEDNRASAIGVGLVGVGLLTAVFGGLFLMDLNVLITGIRDLLCSASEATSTTSPETDF